MRRIAVVSAYALVPMVMAQFTYVLLSNVAIYDEGALLKALLLIGYLWSGWLLFYGVKEAHQFSVSRTLLAILMTVLGMLFCGLILVLVYGCSNSSSPSSRRFSTSSFCALSDKGDIHVISHFRAAYSGNFSGGRHGRYPLDFRAGGGAGKHSAAEPGVLSGGGGNSLL